MLADRPGPDRDRRLGLAVGRHRRIAAADRERNAYWSGDGAILVVRHPHHQAGFHDPYLSWLALNFLSIRRRFRLALLPCPDIPLDGVRLVVTWLQDPIADWSPGGLARAVALVERCARQGIPTVNHPARLAHSGKLGASERLAAVGIRTPRMLPVDAATAPAVRAALPGPILIREDGGHRRPSLLLQSRQPIEPAALARYRQPIAVEFVDTRDADGLIRKRRCLVFGDHVVAGHLIAATEWEVRGENKVKSPALLAEEAEFLARPPVEPELFRRARAALGYDVAAFDYGYGRDGRIVVWEANPYPYIGIGDRAPELRFRDVAVHRAFGAMAGLHLERVGLPAPPAIEMLRNHGAPKTDLLMAKLRMP